MKKMKTPRAVLISDIHFNINTLPLASSALNQAMRKAEVLRVPLLVLGDMHDTKAMLRGECVNSLISLFNSFGETAYILVGNHDLLNEKGIEHSLTFLRNYAVLVSTPGVIDGAAFIPYQASPEAFAKALAEIPQGVTIFMHQGVVGANLGDYVLDHSAVDPEILKDYKVFSGHYHQHQTVGTVTYIGSPYTVTASEANDGPKGFLVLYDDNSFEQIPTNLRKHVTVERTPANILDPIPGLQPADILWVKVKGTYSELKKLNKAEIGKALIGHNNFKLDPIVNEVDATAIEEEKDYSSSELIDKLIEESGETKAQQTFLKSLWRRIA